LKLEIPQSCRYSLDTNSFITSWQRTYPPDLFQPVWNHLDRLINEEQVVASSLVLLELERKADEIHEWAKNREDGFVDLIEPLQNHVRGI
jgi:predicted nucleic acid-binding protein